jgi:predicted ATPase
MAEAVEQQAIFNGSTASYPDAAVADAERALADARDIDQAAELMHALALKGFNSIWCGNYGLAKEEGRQLAALAEEKGSAFFRISGTLIAGLVMAHAGEIENAAQHLKGAISALRSIGATGCFRSTCPIWPGAMLNLIALKMRGIASGMH